jgi:hypothetical protein
VAWNAYRGGVAMKGTFFVFDVESIGLHGEAYAVAGGVYFEDGTVDKESEFLFCCEPIVAWGMDNDRAWVEKNIPRLEPTHSVPKEVREAFWNAWIQAKKSYPEIVMAGECVWPVETGFLTSCVADDPIAREWSGPYPLHEIASVMVAAGMDPMETYDRLESEMPKHNPLADARQSSRLLCEALWSLDQKNYRQ